MTVDELVHERREVSDRRDGARVAHASGTEHADGAGVLALDLTWLNNNLQKALARHAAQLGLRVPVTYVRGDGLDFDADADLRGRQADLGKHRVDVFLLLEQARTAAEGDFLFRIGDASYPLIVLKRNGRPREVWRTVPAVESFRTARLFY